MQVVIDASGDSHSTIGGGDSNNAASGNISTIGGGISNDASDASTIGGGCNQCIRFNNWRRNSNVASNSNSTVGGGVSNNASGMDQQLEEEE